MGLYLAIFKEDGEELDGVEVGSYADFGRLRDTIRDVLERGMQGSRFPVLQLHSDCDGEWSVADCALLGEELGIIANEMSRLPGVPFPEGWQTAVAKKTGARPQSLAEAFIDVDGEGLLERLRSLCDLAVRKRRPIVFQ